MGLFIALWLVGIFFAIIYWYYCREVRIRREGKIEKVLRREVESQREGLKVPYTVACIDDSIPPYEVILDINSQGMVDIVSAGDAAEKHFGSEEVLGTSHPINSRQMRALFFKLRELT